MFYLCVYFSEIYQYFFNTGHVAFVSLVFYRYVHQYGFRLSCIQHI